MFPDFSKAVLQLFWIALFVALLCGLPEIVSTLLNPEYWALKQILK